MMIEELFKNIQNWELSPLMIVFIIIWAISIYIFKDAFVEKIKAFKLNSTFNWLMRRKVERKVKELINHTILYLVPWNLTYQIIFQLATGAFETPSVERTLRTVPPAFGMAYTLLVDIPVGYPEATRSF